MVKYSNFTFPYPEIGKGAVNLSVVERDGWKQTLDF